MSKPSIPKPVSATTVSESLEERLNRHPDLKTKVESLLSVVENAEGDWVKANAAEQRVIEEIRQLGQTALQAWATRQNQVQTEEFIQEHREAKRTRKKTSTGTPASEGLKS
jgi:histidinol dehydrogenase